MMGMVIEQVYRRMVGCQGRATGGKGESRQRTAVRHETEENHRFMSSMSSFKGHTSMSVMSLTCHWSMLRSLSRFPVAVTVSPGGSKLMPARTPWPASLTTWLPSEGLDESAEALLLLRRVSRTNQSVIHPPYRCGHDSLGSVSALIM